MVAAGGCSGAGAPSLVRSRAWLKRIGGDQSLVAQQRVELWLTPAEGAEALQRTTAAADFKDVLAESASGGDVKDAGFFEGTVGIS